MEIDNIQDRIIEEFEKYSDTSHRFKYFRQLVKIGNDLPSIPSSEINTEHIVTGARRKIWLKAWLENGKVFFAVHSKNMISKGLVGLFLKVFSGRSPREIINSNLYFLSEINLYDRLTPEWLEDLLAVSQKIKSLATGLQVKASSA